MKFQLCYTQSDYFGQMKSNTASFNTIRRIDIAEFFSDHSALVIRGLVLLTLWWHVCGRVAGKCLGGELWTWEVEGSRAGMRWEPSRGAGTATTAEIPPIVLALPPQVRAPPLSWHCHHRWDPPHCRGTATAGEAGAQGKERWAMYVCDSPTSGCSPSCC